MRIDDLLNLKTLPREKVIERVSEEFSAILLKNFLKSAFKVDLGEFQIYEDFIYDNLSHQNFGLKDYFKKAISSTIDKYV